MEETNQMEGQTGWLHRNESREKKHLGLGEEGTADLRD